MPVIPKCRTGIRPSPSRTSQKTLPCLLTSRTFRPVSSLAYKLIRWLLKTVLKTQGSFRIRTNVSWSAPEKTMLSSTVSTFSMILSFATSRMVSAARSTSSKRTQKTQEVRIKLPRRVVRSRTWKFRHVASQSLFVYTRRARREIGIGKTFKSGSAKRWWWTREGGDCVCEQLR